MIAYADFIVAFPEFSDTTKYPQSQVDMWLGFFYNYFPQCLGLQYDLAAMLYTAHNVVLSARAAAVGSRGIPGSTGIQSSKTVGPASVTYDVNLTSTKGAGYYNATSYGQRLWQIIRAFSKLLYVRPIPGVRQPPNPDLGYSYWNRNDGF